MRSLLPHRYNGIRYIRHHGGSRRYLSASSEFWVFICEASEEIVTGRGGVFRLPVVDRD